MKRKGLGYMHWVPALVLAILMQVLLSILLLECIPHNQLALSIKARLHISLIIVIAVVLASDGLWYVLTVKRYYDSTVYVGYGLLRGLYRFIDVIGNTLLEPGVYPRDFKILYGIIFVVAYVLMFMRFVNRPSKELKTDTKTTAPTE